MNTWDRFRCLDLDAAVVVELTRDGFLVTVRELVEGIPEDIFYDRKTAATGTGDTVEEALRKALNRMPR